MSRGHIDENFVARERTERFQCFSATCGWVEMMTEMHRLSAERRREKRRCKKKNIVLPLLRATQNVRRVQATVRCKEATQMGAQSRLKGPPPQTRAPVAGKGWRAGYDQESGTPARTYRDCTPALQRALH